MSEGVTQKPKLVMDHALSLYTDQSQITIVFLCLEMLALVVSLNAGGIAIYWGQNGNEGTLAKTFFILSLQPKTLIFFFPFDLVRNSR